MFLPCTTNVIHIKFCIYSLSKKVNVPPLCRDWILGRSSKWYADLGITNKENILEMQPTNNNVQIMVSSYI
jgi:hypothetical protein